MSNHYEKQSKDPNAEKPRQAEMSRKLNSEEGKTQVLQGKQNRVVKQNYWGDGSRRKTQADITKHNKHSSDQINSINRNEIVLNA